MPALYVAFLGLLAVAPSWIAPSPAYAASAAPDRAAALPPSFARVSSTLDSVADDLISLRRQIHQHPELAGQEARTAELVATRMRALGLAVRTDVGGHGVVAVLHGARPGPVIAMRADMDAFASPEPDPVAFRSRVPGVRHICGHDIHTTIAVGVATGLAVVRDEMPGSVVFIFQPAEETATGARAMLAEGAMDDPKPRVIFALHSAPLNVGQIGSQPGLLLAGRDMVTVTLAGRDDLENPAESAESLIRSLTTIASEQAAQPLLEDFVLGNVIRSAPDSEGSRWTVTGFVTATSDSLRADAQRKLEAGRVKLVTAGVACEIEYRRRMTAGVYNDPDLERWSRAPIRTAIGAEGLVPMQGVLPAFSEDFGFFQDSAPGVMYWLGVSNPAAQTVGMPHSSDFVADEGAILVGARAMAAVLLAYLDRSE